jgi:hypothetical protein
MNQNDFNPDWDTVKAYQDKFDELMDEVQQLRAELKLSEGRLRDVAKHCATVEIALRGVNTAAMKLTSELTCMEVDNDDRLDRDRVMERVMVWRNQWEKAMFDYPNPATKPTAYNAGVMAERKRIVNLLMIQHEVAKDRHNYWKVAAELVQADVGSNT